VQSLQRSPLLFPREHLRGDEKQHEGLHDIVEVGTLQRERKRLAMHQPAPTRGVKMAECFPQ